MKDEHENAFFRGEDKKEWFMRYHYCNENFNVIWKIEIKNDNNNIVSE